MTKRLILGISLAAVFVITSIVLPVYALGGFHDLTYAEVKKGKIEASLKAPITSCPPNTVCGVGAFEKDPDGFAAQMVAATVHGFFCDHVAQDPDCTGDIDDPDAPHIHELSFVIDGDCAAGVALAAENDLLGGKLELNGKDIEIKSKIITESTVHAFTVSFGPNGEICPVITDSI